jgi:hypothetical protein
MWHPLRTAVRLRLRPALAGVSRPGRNAFFTASRAGQSHRNPLGLPGEQPGLPRSGSPPRLNISRSLPTKRDIPHVAKVVVVASGKGGVGKSTVAGQSPASPFALSPFDAAHSELPPFLPPSTQSTSRSRSETKPR